MLLRSATAFIWYLLSCSEGFNCLPPLSPFLGTKRPIPACLPAADRLWGSSLLFLAPYVGLSVYPHAGRAEYQFLVYRPQWMCVLFFLSKPNPGVNSARGLSRPYRCWWQEVLLPSAGCCPLPKGTHETCVLCFVWGTSRVKPSCALPPM